MSYKTEQNQKNHAKLSLLLSELPPFCKSYFEYCDGTLDRSLLTMINYAYDIHTFFYFLSQANPSIHSIQEITLDDLDKIKPIDIQEYMSWIKLYTNSKGKLIENDARARARKLSCLRSFFQYYFTFSTLSSNPAVLIASPSIKVKQKEHLDGSEISVYLDRIASGTASTEKQAVYTKKTQLRDTAICLLLIGTGIRVSELVGLDIEDINLEKNRIKIVRKGGNEEYIKFGSDVKNALYDYIHFERQPFDDALRAVFISSRGSNERLTVRSVERIVKKFGKNTLGRNDITPHSLRRTYGSQLYAISSDIYLTAKALGHKNINVTATHYSDISNEKLASLQKYSDTIVQGGVDATYETSNK